MNPPPGHAEFDPFAADYDRALARGLRLAGEDRDFFARGRVAWLARCLRDHQKDIRAVLDFGCGDGAATALLQQLGDHPSITGVDVSSASLAVARERHAAEQVTFRALDELCPDACFDLAFCNGVFHHIAPGERAATLARLFAALRPGGWFALWENNPWNPGTRLIMRRVPFDRDAVLLWPATARRLLRAAGFAVRRTDFCFIFPRWLRWFRPLETALRRLPLGGQYQALAQKPAFPAPPGGR
jgi:SAM-dependent methyltransferase